MMTAKEVQQSLRRQKMLESLGEKFLRSQISKLPPSQAHLLPEEDRKLAGTKVRVAQPLTKPGFLKRHSMRLWTMLKWKLLAKSLKASSSLYWSARRTTWRMRDLKSSSRKCLTMLRAGWPIKRS